MEKFIETKEILIDNKVFTKDDLKVLVTIFIKQSNEILNRSKEIKRHDLIREGLKEHDLTDRNVDTSHSRLEFITSDNSKHTCTFEEIFEANKILDKSKIDEVELHFTENVLDSRFIIKIRYSDSYSASSSSYAIAEGQDSTWITETFSVVKDFLSTCRNQSVFIKKFKILIVALTILILTLFLLNLIEFFIKTQVSFPKIVHNFFTRDLIYFIILLCVITAAPAVFIYKWLRKLFPRIEIQTGKDSHQMQKEKYKKILVISSLIIIPTIISFLASSVVSTLNPSVFFYD